MSPRALLALVLMLSTVSVTGQTPPATLDPIYQAIRDNDSAALRTLIRQTSVNAADGQGQTPLMWAAAFGTADAVRVLLAAGADAAAVTPSGVTALHWAATDAAKVQLLLDAGAKVDAASQLGRTALIVAASANGTADAVRLLLSRGANVHAADATGITALTAAASVNNAAVVELLLAKNADVNARANVPFPATPLMGAAATGNLAVARQLLAKGASVNAVSSDRGAIVKQGMVQFGAVTPLHMAVASGNADLVTLLLQAGATVDARDLRGMTPLMFAVANDRPNPAIVKALVAAGADATIKSKLDEDAAAWAQKFQNPTVLTALKLQPVSLASAHDAEPVSAARNASARAAVERSLPLLRTGSDRTASDGGCVACHAQPLTGIAVKLAHERGWSVPAATDVAQSQASLAGSAPTLMQLRDGGGMPDGQLYQTMLLAAAGTPPNRATDSFVHYLAAKQRAEGNWRGIGASRAPIQDGDFSRTAMAIRALRVYAFPARHAEFQERIDRAAKWLAAQTPLSTEDRVMQLLGLHWADAAPRDRATPIRELRALQRPDGGWAQTTHLSSDAYATGQVVYTLRQLQVPATDPAITRAAAFLLRTQRDDGSWFVRNRAMKIQPYFESGFPYGHDQWISQAATAWAAMALAESVTPQTGTQTAAR